MARKKLPRGIREKGSAYEARAIVNGIKINLYNSNLDELIVAFEAAKEQARMRADYRKNDMTLNEWFEEWFENVKSHRVKETSIAPMKRSYKRTFGFYIGNMKLNKIRPMHIQSAVNAMEKEGRSGRTIQDALGRVRECMEFAVANRMIPSNPCIVIEVPWTYKASKEEIALTQKEQNAFLQAVNDSWYKEMFYFMCLTGVRVGELGALKWEDIDFENELINIKHSLSSQYSDGVKKEMITSPKTVNSTRSIPFIGEMRDMLKSQKVKQAELRKNLGEERWRGKGELDNLVFTTGMGSPCNRYIVQKEIKKVLKRMREDEAVAAIAEHRPERVIRDFHPHTLRHTFATRCFENEMKPKVVQKLMGHSNITVTLNIYTHVLENKMDEEIRKFGTAMTDPNALIPQNIKLKNVTANSHG